ncbi:MAG: AAA family ATPase, partial [Chlamydiia bacterium]|nr:AAA family ATPase [Chlamydiia bacterium]
MPKCRQKIPKLLDIVHQLIESTDKHFILTGSSARKLKRGGANMLAGRAFVYHLHPLTLFEIEEETNLQERLLWGMLPKILEYQQDAFRKKYGVVAIFTTEHTKVSEINEIGRVSYP